MIELLITECKSIGYLNCVNNRYNSVRIFLQRNYDYGLWIDEKFMFSLLSEDQQKLYLEGDTYKNCTFEISRDIAEKLLEEGYTPYRKQTLYD